MNKILAILVGAITGSSGGYVLHQFLSRKDEPDADQQLIVGAPLTIVLGATLIGVAARRRSLLVSFLLGFVAATLLGTRADDAIPGVAEARQRAVAKLNRGHEAA